LKIPNILFGTLIYMENKSFCGKLIMETGTFFRTPLSNIAGR